MDDRDEGIGGNRGEENRRDPSPVYFSLHLDLIGQRTPRISSPLFPSYSPIYTIHLIKWLTIHPLSYTSPYTISLPIPKISLSFSPIFSPTSSTVADRRYGGGRHHGGSAEVGTTVRRRFGGVRHHCTRRFAGDRHYCTTDVHRISAALHDGGPLYLRLDRSWKRCCLFFVMFNVN